MNETALKSGSCLKNGEYSIIRVLGQGGFGITYEAEQVSLRRKVAVKEFFMKDSCERDGSTSHVTVPTASNRELVSKFKDKFIREARMIAGLDHEHIVKIYDVFEENGTAYYVMEYLGGGCLGDGVKAGKVLPEQEALNGIRQIASALSYLHKKGIIHFDVKPSNVLKTEDGKLKLIDFGISKHYDESGMQTSSTPVGISKGYAPLEQYQQGSDIRSFTPATDVYSLGATLYALLSGTNPPEASIVNEDGLPAITGISSAVMTAIEKAMQPRRKDRPQSVSEFLKLLDSPETDDDEETVAPVSNPAPSPNLNSEPQPSLIPSPIPTPIPAPNPKSDRVWKWLRGLLKWWLGILEVSACLYGAFWLVAYEELYGSWQLLSVISIAAMLLCAWLLKISVIRPSGEKLHKYNRVLKKSCIGFVPGLLACVIWFFFPSDKAGTIEYVDLGLSVKWATCNIGAESPEDSGNYYAWGETKTKRLFRDETYKCNGYDDTDGRQELLLSDDVAHIKWGGNWRIPTEAEFQELIDNCTWTRTTVGGVGGYLVTSNIPGYTDKSIFLSDGCGLWTSGLSTNAKNPTRYAKELYFTDDGYSVVNNTRTSGRRIRPVSDK